MKKIIVVGVMVCLMTVSVSLSVFAEPALMVGVDTAGPMVGVGFMNKYGEPVCTFQVNFLSVAARVAFMRSGLGEGVMSFLVYNDFAAGFRPGKGGYVMDKPGLLIKDLFIKVLYWDIGIGFDVTLRDARPHLVRTVGFQYYF